MSKKTDPNSVSKHLDDIADRLIKLSCEDSNYAEDVHSGSYEVIITRINPLVTKETASNYEKLLWTYFQAQKGGLPYSTLYSSVDSELKKKDLSNNDKIACSATLLKVASRLVTNNQLKLATLCGKEAFKLIKENEDFFEEELKTKIKSSVLELTDMELEKARDRKEKNSYIDEIKKLKEEVQNTKWKKDTSNNNLKKSTSNTKNNKSTEADKKKLEEVELKPSSEIVPKESEVKDIKEDPQQEEEEEESLQTPSNFNGRLVLLASIIVACFLCYSSYNIIRESFFPAFEVDDSDFVMPEANSYTMDLSLPKISPNMFLNISFQSNSLASIHKAIDKIDSSNKSSTESTKSDNNNKSDSDADSLQVQKEIEESQKLYAKKENSKDNYNDKNYGDVTEFIKNNASTPPDDDDLASIDEGPDGLLNNTYGSANVPSINPKLMEGLDVRDLGESHKVETHASSVVIGTGGKKYGQQASPKKEAPKFQIEIFRPAKKYVTKIPTIVRTSPTSASGIKDRLKENTYLFVVSKIGDWLEVRKRNGQRGYVYEKDTKLVGVFK